MNLKNINVENNSCQIKPSAMPSFKFPHLVYVIIYTNLSKPYVKQASLNFSLKRHHLVLFVPISWWCIVQNKNCDVVMCQSITHISSHQHKTLHEHYLSLIHPFPLSRVDRHSDMIIITMNIDYNIMLRIKISI